MPLNVFEINCQSECLNIWFEMIQTELSRLEGFSVKLAKTQFLGISHPCMHIYSLGTLVKRLYDLFR